LRVIRAAAAAAEVIREIRFVSWAVHTYAALRGAALVKRFLCFTSAAQQRAAYVSTAL